MNWQQKGNDWYLKLENERNFYRSLEKCVELGGHLAVIRDQASHDAIYSLAGKNDNVSRSCVHVFACVCAHIQIAKNKLFRICSKLNLFEFGKRNSNLVDFDLFECRRDVSAIVPIS